MKIAGKLVLLINGSSTRGEYRKQVMSGELGSRLIMINIYKE